MGRPAKNPEHPLTRLRKALSTPTQEMTRALFSKKVGIPEATIKAIETGKFKLSDKNAAQIASVTKVNPNSLMDPNFPLVDRMNVPLREQMRPVASYFGDEFLDVKAIFDAAAEVAEEKQKQAVFSFLFQRWLEETSELLSLGPAITDKLLEQYPVRCFAAIPKYFWPKDRRRRNDMDERVKRFEEELSVKLVKVLVPEMTDAKTIVQQLVNIRAAFAKKENRERSIAFLERIAQDAALKDLKHAEVAWDLRKKMIEEAKASLEKQPKRSQTR